MPPTARAAPDAASPEAAPGGVRLALLQPGPDTDMAALEGVLHVEGPCLYVVGNDKTRSRTLPAFSFSDVRWDSGTRSLQARGAAFANGQRVLLTGSTPADPARLRWAQRPDPSCDASDLYVVGAIDPAPGRPGPG